MLRMSGGAGSRGRQNASLKMKLKYAGDFESVQGDLVSDLAERGTHEDTMSVNAATRYWAACEAVFVLGHKANETRKRFNLVALTMLVNPRRRRFFLGYMPNDWQLIQRRYLAETAEPIYSNWEIDYETED